MMCEPIRSNSILFLMTVVLTCFAWSQESNSPHSSSQDHVPEKRTGLYGSEKKQLVFLHNAFRGAVKPSATGMVELVWDEDLAAKAQLTAEICTKERRLDITSAKWVVLGKNQLFLGGATTFDVPTTVKFWFSESYRYSLIAHRCVKKSGITCLQYMTLAWADTTKVGCGLSTCDLTSPLVSRGFYVVCYYDGSDYSRKRRPYEQGTPCSRCPLGYSNCKYNLCVSKEMLSDPNSYNGSMASTGIFRPIYSSNRYVPMIGYSPAKDDGGNVSSTPNVAFIVALISAAMTMM